LPLTWYSAATQNLSFALESSRKLDGSEALERIHRALLFSLEQYSQEKRVLDAAEFYSKKMLNSRLKYEQSYQSWINRPSPQALEFLQTRLEKTQKHLTRCEIYLRTQNLAAQVLTNLEQAETWAFQPCAFSVGISHQIFRELEASLSNYAKQRVFNLGVEIEAAALLKEFQACLECKEFWDRTADGELLLAMQYRLPILRCHIQRCEIYLVTRDLHKEALCCIDQAMQWIVCPGRYEKTLQQVLFLIQPALEQYLRERAVKLGRPEFYFGIWSFFQRCIEFESVWHHPALDDLDRLYWDLLRVKNCLRTCEGAIRSALSEKTPP